MGNFVWPLLVRQPCNIRVDSQVYKRWDSDVGAERICQQLGYERGIRGPRHANPEGSGPVHALSHVPHVLHLPAPTCTHSIDQGVICSGGLGPQIATTTTTTIGTAISTQSKYYFAHSRIAQFNEKIYWKKFFVTVFILLLPIGKMSKKNSWKNSMHRMLLTLSHPQFRKQS